ncbi:hypothetical protein AWZ03_001935 [Drosophila navojoa]|uniref:Secreted protein n=1 Tax=Drosophila navojoa TaxID=7232 RepID=A0A484BUB9_DRONA|nr:hypothetical protein AWZ03_001935 [Drosophila navojoa]
MGGRLLWLAAQMMLVVVVLWWHSIHSDSDLDSDSNWDCGCDFGCLKELRMLATGVDCTAKKRRCVKNSTRLDSPEGHKRSSDAVRFGLLMLPQDLTALMSEDRGQATAGRRDGGTAQRQGQCGRRRDRIRQCP